MPGAKRSTPPSGWDRASSALAVIPAETDIGPRDEAPARLPIPPCYHVSLVIPAWNEEGTIRQAVHEAVAALDELTADYEVIVVDDGSTDRTSEVVHDEAACNPRV